jgi:hypothetical protein
MPQLPSGLHFALDPTPLTDLVRAVFHSKQVHDLMAIEHMGHLLEYIDIMYFRPVSHGGMPYECAQNSDRPPTDLEPYPSGYTLRTIRGPFDTWSSEDQAAFEAFLDAPRTREFLQKHLDLVFEAKDELLSKPATLPGLLATWWKAGCHPLQEDRNDPA